MLFALIFDFSIFILFHIVQNVKSTHPGHKSLRCVTGNRAQMSREAGLQLISEVMDLYNLVNGKEVNDVDLVRIPTKIL